MIDNETDAMLRAEEARLEAKMERDLADLARLDAIRGHARIPKLLGELRSMRNGARDHAEFWKATADVSRFVERVQLLDELLKLLEATRG